MSKSLGNISVNSAVGLLFIDMDCPRNIVTLGTSEPSKYAPRPGYQPPEPAWNGFEDYVHPRQKTPDGL